MADLAQIAQSGVDPVSGSYLSAEKRKAIFARSRISSSVFTGRGALVPISNKPDSGDLLAPVIKNQTDSIYSLQQQVNTLRTQVANLNNVISVQTQSISGLQEQIGGLKTEVSDFSGALSRATDVIAYDSVLEQNRIRQDQEEQRRATEQGLRSGRESLVEQRIQNALIAPVQAIAQKTQSILSRLADFFKTLFLGWLTDKGINVLKALSEGNTKKLEEIRDNVLKGLGIAAATLFLLNGGFIAIASTITRLSLKIGGWLLKNTIGRFFGALGKLLTSAGAAVVSAGKIGVRAITGGGARASASATAGVGAITGGGAAAATSGVGAKVAGAEAKAAGGFLENAGNLFKGAKGLGSKLFAPINIGISAYRFSQGDVPGGLLSAASAVPVIGLPAVGVDIAREFGAFEGTFLGKNETKKEQPKAVVKPQTPAVPNNKESKAPNAPAVDNGQSFNQTMGDLTSKANEIDWTKPAQFGEFNITPDQGTSPQVSSQPAQVNVKPAAQTTRMPSPAVNVGPAPEPAPNIIYKRIGSSAQRQSGVAPTGGSVNQVPAISASNPDNFYVLYSQVNYNVVT
jgi:hypothetical protein